VAAIDNLLIRAYQKADEVEISRLLNLVFHEKRPLQEWQWKFQENPAGFSIITIAEWLGKIYGQYASLVIPFKFKEQSVLVGQPVDTVIHPDFRGTGRLLQRLFASASLLAQENNIAFGFGFPNEIHYPVGKRILKYQDIGPLRILFRKLNWRNAVRRRLPMLPQWILHVVGFISNAFYRVSLAAQRRHGIAVREVSTFDERINELWEKAKGSYDILAIRDQQYLNWRYLTRPSGQYRILIGERAGTIVGYLVLKLSQEGEVSLGLVVDGLSLNDAKVDDAMIRAAMGRFLVKKVDYVHCWALKEDRFFQALMRCGFREHPGMKSIPVVCFVFSGEVDETFLKDPRHWHLTIGDTDGV
jgi:hypothetical protein